MNSVTTLNTVAILALAVHAYMTSLPEPDLQGPTTSRLSIYCDKEKGNEYIKDWGTGVFSPRLDGNQENVTRC